jgi:hypothetical protein
MEIRNIVQATALVALVAGCATSTAVPKERIASSEAAVRTAEQMRQMSPATPEADHHLKLAREELRAAHAELADDNDRRAEMLFIRARTDAELAQALALKAKAESERHELQTELERIKATTPPEVHSHSTTTPGISSETKTTVTVPEEGTVKVEKKTRTKKVEVKKSGEQATANEPTPDIPEEHAEHMKESDD